MRDEERHGKEAAGRLPGQRWGHGRSHNRVIDKTYATLYRVAYPVVARTQGRRALSKDRACSSRRCTTETVNAAGRGVTPSPWSAKGLTVVTTTQMVPRRTDLATAAGEKPEYMLNAEEITKSFDGLEALDKVDISVRAGSIHGLIGPNGSGKSTFFNVVTGILPATSGRVEFCSRDITRLPAHKIAELGIGRTFQGGLVFPRLTCLENVMSGMYGQTSIDVIGTFLRLPFTRSKQEKRIAEAASDMLDFVGLGPSAMSSGQRSCLGGTSTPASRPCPGGQA